MTVKVPRLGGLKVSEVGSLAEAVAMLALFQQGQG